MGDAYPNFAFDDEEAEGKIHRRWEIPHYTLCMNAPRRYYRSFYSFLWLVTKVLVVRQELVACQSLNSSTTNRHATESPAIIYMVMSSIKVDLASIYWVQIPERPEGASSKAGRALKRGTSCVGQKVIDDKYGRCSPR